MREGHSKGVDDMALIPYELKSGNYRCRVYDKETGKRISFTAPSEEEAIMLAMQWKLTHKTKAAPANITVEEAVEEYIASKENVLSPSTVRGYMIIKRNALGDIGKVKIRKITEKDLQKWINANAKKYKPKALKNQLGLVGAALRQNDIDINTKAIRLPAAPKYEPIIPTEEQVGQILRLVEGTNVELPVTIAVTLGLRQSEIAALKWSDYDGTYIYVHAAKVPDKDNKTVYKDTTKSQASTRVLEVDAVLKQRLDRAERKSEFISTMTANSVLKRFQQLCEREGLPKFTMHGQRHGNASLMLANGVPDKYAMERLGQSSTSMIKRVYQHLYSDKKREVSQVMSDKFSAILDTKLDTDSET